MKRKRKARQNRTRPTSWRTIAESDAFKAGLEDALAGRGYRPEYECGGALQSRQIGYDQRWAALTANWQWNYERGRQWAAITGGVSPFNGEGKVSIKARDLLHRLGDGIL
jgi:hypothetical protein